MRWLHHRSTSGRRQGRLQRRRRRRRQRAAGLAQAQWRQIALLNDTVGLSASKGLHSRQLAVARTNRAAPGAGGLLIVISVCAKAIGADCKLHEDACLGVHPSEHCVGPFAQQRCRICSGKYVRRLRRTNPPPDRRHLRARSPLHSPLVLCAQAALLRPRQHLARQKCGATFCSRRCCSAPPPPPSGRR